MHLGVQIRGHRLPDNTGKLMWSMSAEKCLNKALHKLDTILLKKGKYLPTKVVKPLFNNYCPEMDVSPLLVQLHHTLYMQLVGILHWAVELGRVDIHLSVALMAQYLAQPHIRIFGSDLSYFCLYQSTTLFQYYHGSHLTICGS